METLPRCVDIVASSKNNFDASLLGAIIAIHRWEMVGYITLGINSATVALLMGYGYTKLTMLINVSRVFLLWVPVLWAFENFTSLGDEESKPLFMWPKDNTHLKPEGAVRMAGFLAEGLATLGEPYSAVLAAPEEPCPQEECP